jgi:hypothetical protein
LTCAAGLAKLRAQGLSDSVEKLIMRKYLHFVLIALFVLLLLAQCLFWGGAAALPELGPVVKRSAQREAPVVSTLMFCGEWLGKALPPLADTGREWAAKALEPAAARLKDDPDVAMDFIFSESLNSSQRMAVAGFYALPLLLVLAALAWWLRPRQVRMLGGRRR